MCACFVDIILAAILWGLAQRNPFFTTKTFLGTILVWFLVLSSFFFFSFGMSLERILREPEVLIQKKIFKPRESIQNTTLPSFELLRQFSCHFLLNFFGHPSDIILLHSGNIRILRLELTGSWFFYWWLLASFHIIGLPLSGFEKSPGVLKTEFFSSWDKLGKWLNTLSWERGNITGYYRQYKSLLIWFLYFSCFYFSLAGSIIIYTPRQVKVHKGNITCVITTSKD